MIATIRSADSEHLNDVVRLHQQAFPGFFLTRLGPSFLRTYYRAVMDYERGVTLIAVTPAGRIDGFVTGFVAPGDFYRRLRESRWRLMIAALPAVLRAPSLSRRLLHHRQRGSLARNGRGLSVTQCELSSIGVSPAARGSGIGRALVRSFLLEAAERGADHVDLTTDARQNDYVNQFYRSLEFSLVESFDAGGDRPMHRYRFTLQRNDRQTA